MVDRWNLEIFLRDFSCQPEEYIIRVWENLFPPVILTNKRVLFLGFHIEQPTKMGIYKEKLLSEIKHLKFIWNDAFIDPSEKYGLKIDEQAVFPDPGNGVASPDFLSVAIVKKDIEKAKGI